MLPVCAAGTFDRFHEGHKELLRCVIKTAEEGQPIILGVMSDEYVKKKPCAKQIQPYSQRQEAVLRFLRDLHADMQRIEIVPLDDTIGPLMTLDCTLVCSGESVMGAHRINEKRRQVGKQPVKVVVCKLVLDEDGSKLSSSTLRSREVSTQKHPVDFINETDLRRGAE